MRPRRGRTGWVIGAACAGACLLWGERAGAESDAEMFARGVSSLQEGAYEKAISLFEGLADRGFTHPDAAYDRGLSYLARVRAHAEQPGDLGRAAAGFEETVQLRPEDKDAEAALELVRAEVARRSALRGGSTQVQARPAVGRAIVDLAPESAWAALAALGSIALTAGLILRRMPGHAKRLAGLIAVPIGALVLVVFAGLAGAARHVRHTTSQAVVTAPEARMLDERGLIRNVEPVPEAARVEVLERKGALVRIRYGTTEGWTQSGSVRVLSGGAGN